MTKTALTLQTLKLIKHTQNYTLTMYHILLDKTVYSDKQQHHYNPQHRSNIIKSLN